MSLGPQMMVALGCALAALGRFETVTLANGSVQRTRPPVSLTCTRDHLTSFQGQVLEYKRGKQEITLRVRTDEATTENFTLKWDAADDASKWLLLAGAALKADDWKSIESGPGKLRDGMRVIVWVCDDGSKPVFDWRPKG